MKTKKNRKMKKSVYKPVMLFFATAVLLSFTLTAQEVSKEFHKEYKADQNTTFDLSNRYGDPTCSAQQAAMVEILADQRAEKRLGPLSGVVPGQ